jgi:hypothetical protein
MKMDIMKNKKSLIIGGAIALVVFLLYLTFRPQNGRYVPVAIYGEYSVYSQITRGYDSHRYSHMYYMDTQTGKYYEAEYVEEDVKEY